MVRLVASVILLLIVAILVVLNAGFMTPFNLFGYSIESVPVIGVALISFAVGVLYSFILYAVNYIHKNRKRRLSARENEVKRVQREQKKSAKQQPSESAAASSAAASGGAGSAQAALAEGQAEATESGKKGKRRSRLSRKK